MISNQDDNLDEILSNLKSEYQTSNSIEKTEKTPNSELVINNLLEEFKSEINSKENSNKPDKNIIQNIESIQKKQQGETTDNAINNLLEEFKSENRDRIKTNQANTDNTIHNYSLINQDIESIKAEYQSHKNDQKRQSELIFNRNKQDIIKQEQQKQLQLKELTRQAKQWLANLDPTSDEGMWFNQLAESYPTKLDAAINYLQTLK